MANSWTVLLLTASHGALARRLTEARGLRVLLTGDLYDAGEGSLALEVVRQTDGPLLAAGPYYSRAIYWLLRAAGLRGPRADLPGKAGGEGREIHCLDTTGLDEEQIEQRIAAVASGAEGGVTDLRESMAERWYPVIDYDRCSSCLQCAEFCLFGVYDVVDGRATVANPDLCKPGCPACSRVCPAGAIMFPRYHARGPIAGADEGRPPQVRADQARQAAAPDVQAYQRNHAAQARQAKPPAADGLHPQALIDKLDAMES